MEPSGIELIKENYGALMAECKEQIPDSEHPLIQLAMDQALKILGD